MLCGLRRGVWKPVRAEARVPAAWETVIVRGWRVMMWATTRRGRLFVAAVAVHLHLVEEYVWVGIAGECEVVVVCMNDVMPVKVVEVKTVSQPVYQYL